jgi:antitoxin MazE
MKASIVSIGNSKGIRIPKAILQQCGIGSEVKLEVKGGRIVLSPIDSVPRQGWREALGKMHAVGEDAPLWPDGLDLDLDLDGWEWP